MTDDFCIFFDSMMVSIQSGELTHKSELIEQTAEAFYVE